MKNIVSLIGILFWFQVSWGQDVRVRKFEAPLVGVQNFDEYSDAFNAQVFSVEAPPPDGNWDKKRLRELKKESAQKFPRKKSNTANKTTSAPMPILDINYIADSLSGIPPDNDFAVSKGQKSVAVMNSNIAIHDATTGQMIGRTTLKAFSNVLGLNSIFSHHRYDPKILYDPIADRYICVLLVGTNQNNWIGVAFSQSNDPQGNWNWYKFYGDELGDTTWFDYPGVAITKDELFLTGNKIKFNASWQSGFKQTVIYQIDKSSGYDSAAVLNYQIIDGIKFNNAPIRNLFPVKSSGLPQGPEMYFLSNRNFDVVNDTFFLVKVPDTIGSGNNNVTIQALVSPLPYGVPPEGRQVDTFTLATNDGRVLGAFSHGNAIQFTSTSVNPNNGSASVYLGHIDNYQTNPSVTASFFSVDTLDFGYPNLSYIGEVNGKATSIINFNFSGPNRFPGMGALLFDGNEYSDMLTVKEGTNSIEVLNSKSQRWGDYTGSQRDYLESGAVWVDGIYGYANKRYGSWAARLVSPLTTNMQTVSSGFDYENVVYPNPTMAFLVLRFNNPNAQVLNFVVSNINGQLTQKILTAKCKMGENQLSFDTGSLASGTYLLQVCDENKAVIFSHKFVKH